MRVAQFCSCFQAIRRMDEIQLANFMTFHDLVRDDDYDLWIGDESWELDYYLHENPEQKRAAYAWLTDFVGWLPIEDGGAQEAFLTADYNAEMIEHIARFPRVRDRAVFVGSPEDIVPDTFGPGLPSVREWTRQHYDFAGYITHAYQRGMRANDLVLYVNLATGIWTSHTVVTCTAAAGADLSDATTLSGNTAGD